MGTFSNQVNIKGCKSDIIKFFHDESCIPYESPEFCYFDDIIYTEFATNEEPCYKWFNFVQHRYPQLKFNLFYRDIHNGLSCGFIDPVGSEFQLSSAEDFKLACMLLSKYKEITTYSLSCS